MEFYFEAMSIPDVLLITHGMIRDQRGFFTETFREEPFLKLGIPRFIQDNHAHNISWPVADPVLSPKDENAPLLKGADNNFVWRLQTNRAAEQIFGIVNRSLGEV